MNGKIPLFDDIVIRKLDKKGFDGYNSWPHYLLQWVEQDVLLLSQNYEWLFYCRPNLAGLITNSIYWCIDRHSNCGHCGHYSVGQDHYLTKEVFLDKLKTLYPDHFMMLLFHPELLDI